MRENSSKDSGTISDEGYILLCSVAETQKTVEADKVAAADNLQRQRVDLRRLGREWVW
jgi:hypothetical protein